MYSVCVIVYSLSHYLTQYVLVKIMNNCHCVYMKYGIIEMV